MKKNNWVIFLSFLIGILIANLMGRDWLKTYGSLNAYRFQNLNIDAISMERYFFHILWLRLKLVFYVWIMNRIFSNKVTVKLCWCILFFSAGLLLSCGVIESGLAGVGYLVIAGFPHVIFYVMAFYLWQKKVTGDLYVKNYYKYSTVGKREELLLGSLWFIGIIMLMVAGAAIESWISPYFIKKLIIF